MYARHLQRAIGRPLSHGELESMIARSLRFYARYWLEVLAAGSIDREFARTAIDIDRRELIADAVDRGTGCILALAHLGNWDLAGAHIAAQGWPLSSVMEVLPSPRLYEFFLEVRRSLGMKIYPLDGTSAAARGLLRDLRQGTVVALLADRDLLGDGVEVDFFGERTTAPGGPATLSLRTGAPLIPTGLYAKAGGRYDAVLRPPVAPPEGLTGRKAVSAMTQAMVVELEGLIRRAPEQWHLLQPNWPSDRRASVGALSRLG
jgi:KDO2-lipid IV(A) lauroyltransferase